MLKEGSTIHTDLIGFIFWNLLVEMQMNLWTQHDAIGWHLGPLLICAFILCDVNFWKSGVVVSMLSGCECLGLNRKEPFICLVKRGKVGIIDTYTLQSVIHSWWCPFCPFSITVDQLFHCEINLNHNIVQWISLHAYIVLKKHCT